MFKHFFFLVVFLLYHNLCSSGILRKVDEKVQMLAQNFSCQADCLIRSKSSVCEYIQCQLIKVGNSITRVFLSTGHIDTLYRCIDGIHCNHADW